MSPDTKIYIILTCILSELGSSGGGGDASPWGLKTAPRHTHAPPRSEISASAPDLIDMSLDALIVPLKNGKMYGRYCDTKHIV